jgi:recombination protein RecR
MAVAVRQVHGVFQVVKGAATLLALVRLHQLGLPAAALGGDHVAAQGLAHRHRAAQAGEIALGSHLRNHQAEGFVAVDQVVEHHRRAAAHLHPRPAGGVEEGVAAIRALVAVEARGGAAAGRDQQGQRQRHQAAQQGSRRQETDGRGGHGRGGRGAGAHSAGRRAYIPASGSTVLSGYTRPLARLIEQFERLPGIGPRTAQRLALHLLRQPEEQIRSFADALLAARSQVGQCRRCFHLSAEPLCEICRNPERHTGQICVVADSRDLLAMERTREFKGNYHVLGGLISPMDGIGPELLQIQPLVQRVAAEPPEGGVAVTEVILALTPSVEGDTTSLYLARLLRPFAPVSRIAYGLPMGSELEYADEVTLARALEGRRPVE